MIILCWLKLPSSAPKIAPIEQLLLRISKQTRTISAQPNSNQAYSALPWESSEQAMIILCWLKLPLFVLETAQCGGWKRDETLPRMVIVNPYLCWRSRL